MHALIIEDNHLIVEGIEDLLRGLGYSSFDIATREADAVQAAEDRCPDLITADDRLTDGSGIKAVRVICQRRAIPVVIVAAVDDLTSADIPHAVLLPKPFSEVDFRRAVADAVELIR